MTLFRFFLISTILLTGCSALAQTAGALQPDSLRVLPAQDGEMMARYFSAQAEQATAKRLARLRSLKSAADIQKWQEENRGRFVELIGGLPQERTPLNARVVGELKRDGYTIRKVIFESLPELYVTANLYVPSSGKGPFPAVLAPNGHSRNGKAYPEYQRLYVGLVRQGYVVLTWDNLGQGERFEFWDYVFDHRRLMDKSNEHGMSGTPEYLLGRCLARELVWDGLRAMDYLASLPEVDVSRIAVTGNSGGGTLTAYISMIDPRVKAASVVTWTTTIPKKIEARAEDSEADPEQDVFGLLGAGLDHTEIDGAIAPRPLLIGAALRDFFPIEGTRKTFEELKDLYRTAGAADQVNMVAFDHEHLYSQPLREATTTWFTRWLKGDGTAVRELPLKIEEDRTLECTSTGQVLTSLGGKRLMDLNRAELRRLSADVAARRKEPAFRGTLRMRIRERLMVPTPEGRPNAQALGTVDAGDLVVEKLTLESEPGIVVPLRVVRMKSAAGRLPAVLYLRDRDGRRDDPAVYEQLARAGRLVAIADVRGFGETQSPRNVPDKRMTYFNPRDGMDADFTYAAFALGRTLVGMRVRDAECALLYLRGRADVEQSKVVVSGRGWAGLIALYAAALDSGSSAVAVEHVPGSYASILTTESYAQPVSQMAPGVLKQFDLVDVFSFLAPRPLLVLNPENAETRIMVREDAGAALAGVASSYAAVGKRPALSIEVAPVEPEVRAKFVEWILKH